MIETRASRRVGWSVLHGKRLGRCHRRPMDMHVPVSLLVFRAFYASLCTFLQAILCRLPPNLLRHTAFSRSVGERCTKFEVNRTNIQWVMISAVPSVSSVHVELDGRLPSTVGRTDETTKVTRTSWTSPNHWHTVWCPFSRVRQQFYSLHANATEHTDY
jgi:hypothetical protein